MNRINPLYLLLFVTIVMIGSFVLLGLEKEYFLEKQKEQKSFEKKVLRYDYLKKQWYSEKEAKEQIHIILKDKKFAKATIVSNFKTKIATITLTKTNKNTINYLVNKVLNKKLRINNLKISKSSVIIEVVLK